MKVGKVYRVQTGDLRPTQFAVGVTEVSERMEHIGTLGKHELRKYLKEHTGSAVIGPGGDIFLVDGHHVTLAVARGLGDKAEVLVKILDDWSSLSRAAFFKRMIREKRLWPYDQNGKGPLDPNKLPETVHGLKNDPFRSLAYLVRKHGGIKDIDVPFLEFMWANYFRELIPRSTVVSNPESALKRALSLASAPEASKLPGYLPGHATAKACERLLRI